MDSVLHRQDGVVHVGGIRVYGLRRCPCRSNFLSTAPPPLLTLPSLSLLPHSPPPPSLPPPHCSPKALLLLVAHISMPMRCPRHTSLLPALLLMLLHRLTRQVNGQSRVNVPRVCIKF